MGDLNEARILIVDDEITNVRLLDRLLKQAGFHNIMTTTDPRQARSLYEELQPDLVMLDLMMPHLDGIAVMAELPIPAAAYVPILALTAEVTAEAKQRALTAGAKDFLTKPFDRLEVLLRIKNLLNTRFLYLELERQNRSLEEIVADRTQRLLQSEKVATMGALLAGVAHELNNPLAVILGQCHLMRASTTDPKSGVRAEKIIAAAERCTRIVRNFLAMARQRAPERGDVRLNMVVQEAMELLAYELRTDDVQVALALGEQLPVLWADGHQLHQVVLNIVANAHHAMRRGGGPRRLTITTGWNAATERIDVTIADTGPGIAPEIRAKIFEPFFTTKPSGQGTGLGLSLCQGIIESHGGTIRVESEPGQGTTFFISLPVLPRPAVVTTQAAPSAPAPVGSKTIMVVDDESEVAAILAESLQQDGYRVETVTDGAEALRRLERGGYDLVLSDTKMPVLSGTDFYRVIEQRFPALIQKFIFVTGDLLDVEKQQFFESVGVPVVSKPFNVDEVRRVVRNTLATPSAR